MALEETFRRERAQVIGALARMFRDLDLAEEAFSAAVLAAVESWKAPPDNPGAWLTAAAKNHARDVLRRRRVAADNALQGDDSVQAAESTFDDQLRLIFTCCHPALQVEWQVALTLKVVCGFETGEIARAFLLDEPALAQRIVRAKRFIEERALPYVVPDARDLPRRLGAVLAVVYAIFNEGYTSSRGPLIRLDLQAEALRLARLLCDLLPDEPEVFGLTALMAFAASRASTRTDAGGRLLLLSEQDRSAWNRALIKEGLIALQRARRDDGPYRWQAEIAAQHATTTTYEDTDWRAILACYDRLCALTASPVVAMNRAIALGMCDGAQAALAALEPLAEALQDYHLYHATRADFLRRNGDDARPAYERALALASNEAEREFLRSKL